MSGKSNATTDHNVVRKWIEDRGGKPAQVKSAANEESALLRIDFGEPEESLEQIDWDRFFEIFEREHLVLLYQEKTADGKISRFHKFIRRGTNN